MSYRLTARQRAFLDRCTVGERVAFVSKGPAHPIPVVATETQEQGFLPGIRGLAISTTPVSEAEALSQAETALAELGTGSGQEPLDEVALGIDDSKRDLAARFVGSGVRVDWVVPLLTLGGGWPEALSKHVLTMDEEAFWGLSCLLPSIDRVARVLHGEDVSFTDLDDEQVKALFAMAVTEDQAYGFLVKASVPARPDAGSHLFYGETLDEVMGFVLRWGADPL